MRTIIRAEQLEPGDLIGTEARPCVIDVQGEDQGGRTVIMVRFDSTPGRHTYACDQPFHIWPRQRAASQG